MTTAASHDADDDNGVPPDDGDDIWREVEAAAADEADERNEPKGSMVQPSKPSKLDESDDEHDSLDELSESLSCNDMR